MKVKDIKTSIKEIFKCTKEGAVTEMHIKILEARGIKPLNVTDLWSWRNEWDSYTRYADHDTDPKPSWEFPVEVDTSLTLGELAESVELDTLNSLIYYILYKEKIKIIMSQVFDDVARALLPNPLDKWKELGPHEHLLMQGMQFTLPVAGGRTLEKDAYLFEDIKSTPYWLDFIKFYKETRALSEPEQRALGLAIDAFRNLRVGWYSVMVDDLVGVVKAKGDYRQAREAIKEAILNCNI